MESTFTFYDETVKTKSFYPLIYSVLTFPALLCAGLAYYALCLPVMVLVGFCVVTYGITKKVDWATYDTILAENNSGCALFLLSFWLNRREPMPAGGKKHLWESHGPLYRYVRWHLRNPLPDLGAYYVGFFGKKYEKVDVLSREHLEVNLKKLARCPFWFPRYILQGPWGMEFSLGWKKRGAFSIHLKRKG